MGEVNDLGHGLGRSGRPHSLPLQAFSLLNSLGQIGVIFYMFLVGMKLDKSLGAEGNQRISSTFLVAKE
jgi:hypothetical protein